MRKLSTDEDYNLWLLLSNTRNVIFRIRQRELRAYKTSPGKNAGLLVIKALGENATPAEIGKWLFKGPSTVSELLSRMEQQGLIKKTRLADIGNSIRIELTAEGHELYKQTAKGESIKEIMAVLSEKEKKQLRSLLLTLRDHTLTKMGKDIYISPEN